MNLLFLFLAGPAWVGITNPGGVTDKNYPLKADFVEANFEWLDGTPVTFYKGLVMKGL